MTNRESFEERLDRLARATDLASPPGLDARILAALEAEPSSGPRRDFVAALSRKAIAVAACAMVASVALAVWHDDRFVSSMLTAPDGGADLAQEDP